MEQQVLKNPSQAKLFYEDLQNM